MQSCSTAVSKDTRINQTFMLQRLLNLSTFSCHIYKMGRNAISGCNYALVNRTLC